MQQSVSNESGLEPLGRAVLIRMVELEKRKNALIEIPEHVRANADVMQQRAIIVAVGSEAWSDERAPRAKPGDKVIVTRLAGYTTKGADGQLYRMVNDRDIFCRVTREAEVTDGL